MGITDAITILLMFDIYVIAAAHSRMCSRTFRSLRTVGTFPNAQTILRAFAKRLNDAASRCDKSPHHQAAIEDSVNAAQEAFAQAWAIFKLRRISHSSLKSRKRVKRTWASQEILLRVDLQWCHFLGFNGCLTVKLLGWAFKAMVEANNNLWFYFCTSHLKLSIMHSRVCSGRQDWQTLFRAVWTEDRCQPARSILVLNSLKRRSDLPRDIILIRSRGVYERGLAALEKAHRGGSSTSSLLPTFYLEYAEFMGYDWASVDSFALQLATNAYKKSVELHSLRATDGNENVPMECSELCYCRVRFACFLSDVLSQHSLARKQYLQAVEAEPLQTKTFPLAHMAGFCIAAGQRTEAASLLRRALELQPTNLLAMSNLAILQLNVPQGTPMQLYDGLRVIERCFAHSQFDETHDVALELSFLATIHREPKGSLQALKRLKKLLNDGYRQWHFRLGNTLRMLSGPDSRWYLLLAKVICHGAPLTSLEAWQHWREL